MLTALPDCASADRAETLTPSPPQAGASSLPPSLQLDERFTQLQQSACELLADGFEELDGFIADYVQEASRSPCDTETSDAERFLQWLAGRSGDLTGLQQDDLASGQSRYAVEFVAVRQRLAHARFQQLLSGSAHRLGELASSRRMMLHLNPIRVWATFQTRPVPGEEAGVPANVLFYAVGGEVRSAVVEPRAAALLRDLERSGPVRVREFLRMDACLGDPEGLCEIVRELVTLGIVAVS